LGAVPTSSRRPEAPSRCLQGSERGIGRKPRGNGKACRHQRIGELEAAGQRYLDLMDAALGHDLGALAVALMLDPLELQEIALAADGADVQTCLLGDGNRRR
jgi:hypothetical protein